MLADEEEANEVIKVSNLVAKFESEIRRQTANERLIHTVRQVIMYFFSLISHYSVTVLSLFCTKLVTYLSFGTVCLSSSELF